MIVVFWFAVYAAMSIGVATVAYRSGIRIGAERLLAMQNAETKSKAIAPAINFVENVLLPDPDDPRWVYLADPYRMQLGDVYVYLAPGVKELRIGTLTRYIRWTDYKKTDAYCGAVVDAWCNRQSMNAIEHADFPQKDPQLKLAGV